ncbi:MULTISPECIES: type II toxin-antitoxin system prevent-host-death family antitoxin [unclassified Acinetobacter]|uniref:type II toxin-antitoxin system Phd/YefM family antitoxin n=1 Tax=unclassified Acinetobacter TaxID=196816 RepID=UPI0029353110|nr:MULTISPECIES: type II toxin-antitoxin system prevent-host-death family antitoxin [unclassified Acinetobacter]WOE32253.1 type II toxin-antitoxin system prevent-host-death family antitoxin [Acinetobacter sp. SAAs470]WOE37723.1 type II toxin-antitoxin system prevent-host-death family antitoxin [Acinetobacter sp. SAAs474]
MKVVTYSDLRKNLATVLDGVIDDHSPVLVTRKNNQTAVLISLEDFNAYEETAYLMSSPTNAAHLMKSIAQFKSGKISQHELIEE